MNVAEVTYTWLLIELCSFVIIICIYWQNQWLYPATDWRLYQSKFYQIGDFISLCRSDQIRFYHPPGCIKENCEHWFHCFFNHCFCYQWFLCVVKRSTESISEVIVRNKFVEWVANCFCWIIKYVMNSFLGWAVQGYEKHSLALIEANSYQPNRLFLNYLCSIYLYPQNVLSPTIRDLKMLESSVFHQNVFLSSLLSKFISDFENPFRKTSERRYSQFSVIFFLDTVIYRH